MECHPPGSSVHRIFQKRVLEWVAIPFSGGSLWPRVQTQIACIAGRFFTIWVTREAKIIHVYAKFTEINFLQSSEKAMAPHSITLAWQIPWTEEPGRLQSMGSLRVRHDWATSLSLFTFMHWSRQWQPTPVFLPGESQGWGSLVGFHLWGCTESDTTGAT